METPITTKTDLEVTGISRSGRVRKKSSKLMDFQSPDEIEPRIKKSILVKQNQQIKVQTSISSPTFEKASPVVHGGQNVTFSSDIKSDDEISGDEYIPDENDESPGSEADSDDDIGHEGEEHGIDENAIIDNDDDDEDNVLDPTIRQSIYMSEKTNKKKIMKDGKLVFGKAHRKDKGKTRFTAYMLWARDIRKQMINQQPDLDFATISRRLGDMWGNVPKNEKYIWKRRAKRLQTKSKTMERKDTKFPTKFLNKGLCNTNRTRKLTDSSQQSDIQDINISPSNIVNKNGPSIPCGLFKVTGIEPIDVAAHLKLLGDSLTIIGERLKEHEGQITVSGSLSVLMDSLLCSLGPLMCLTTQIHGLNDNRQLKDTLQSTLDNIAYVMPGL